MEITVTITGELLNSRLAAKQLHLIADMVKAGVTDMDGANIEYDGAFSMMVDFDPESHVHHDYWDGEGNHIHVNEEGIVVTCQAPDSPDGTVNLERLFDKGIKLSEWAEAHGGITPFGTPEEDLKDG